MPDELKPVVITKQKPGDPPSFERDLESRVNKARENFQQSHSELFGPPPVAAAPVTQPESTPVIEPAAPPAELPIADENAPVPVEMPPEPDTTPAPSPAPAAPAPQPEPEPPKPVQTTPQDFEGWRSYRKLERENRRLLRELEAAKKGQPLPPAAPAAISQPPAAAAVTPPAATETPLPPVDDDPFGVKAAAREAADAVRREFEQREQERITRDAENEQRRYAEDLDRQEREFSVRQPDYYNAVQHITNWERQRFQLSGGAVARASEIINDPQYIPAIEKIADEFVFIPAPNQEGVLLTARRDQLTPEQRASAREMSDAEAAITLATDLWLAERRNEILKGARVQHRMVPEVVWDLATKVAGFTPRLAAAAPVQQPSSPTPNGNGNPAPGSVAERIRQQARVNAATKSVSGLSSGVPGEPQAMQIRTLAEWSAFQRRDPQAARKYMDQMSRIDPNWHRNLSA